MQNLPEFLNLIHQLKQLRRTGWVRNGVPDAESVADHSYAVAVLALLLSDEIKMDRNRCIAMALVHDLVESITGDIAPGDGITPEDKRARESAAARHIADLADRPDLYDLWQEYADNQTLEAKIVHELDALDLASQALAYQRAGDITPDAAQSFLASASAKIHSDAVRQILKRLRPD